MTLDTPLFFCIGRDAHRLDKNLRLRIPNNMILPNVTKVLEPSLEMLILKDTDREGTKYIELYFLITANQDKLREHLKNTPYKRNPDKLKHISPLNENRLRFKLPIEYRKHIRLIKPNDPYTIIGKSEHFNIYNTQDLEKTLKEQKHI